MVGALTLQKRYLPLAELEPQLWYKPFSASAYQGMVAAQEEVQLRPAVGKDRVEKEETQLFTKIKNKGNNKHTSDVNPTLNSM